MNYEHSHHESMSDLLLTVLIIFLLMIVILSLDVSNKIKVTSKTNTYSGGKIAPTLLVDPVYYENGDEVITFYQMNDFYISGDNLFTTGLEKNIFMGLISFINPGEYIDSKGETKTTFAIKLYSESHDIYNIRHKTRSGVTGYVKKEILYDALEKALIKKQIPLEKEASTNLPRVKIYYQSNKKDQEIIIGHYRIKTGNDTDIEPFLKTIATSLTDFVYLGEYTLEDRINEFRKYGGDDAAYYYKKAINGELPTNALFPLVQYPEIRDKIIANREKLDIQPPLWVKKNFLNKIGANLKIIEDQQSQ